VNSFAGGVIISWGPGSSTAAGSSDRDELIEVRANAFAAAFLAPDEGVRQLAAALGKGKPSRASAQVFDEAGAVQATLLSMHEEEIDQLLERAGLAAGEAADVLLPE